MIGLLNSFWFCYGLAVITILAMAWFIPTEWLAQVCPKCFKLFRTPDDLELHDRSEHADS
jgi:hypothetical protein